MSSIDHARPQATTFRLTIRNLVVLHDAYAAASAAILSVLNMPRCTGPVADILEDEVERMDKMREAAIAELRRQEPTTLDDIDDRVKVLVAWEASGEDWPEVANLLGLAAIRRLSLSAANAPAAVAA